MVKILRGDFNTIVGQLDRQFAQVDTMGIDATVREIIETVRRDGDNALRHYSEKFDGVALKELRVSSDTIDAAYQATDPKVLEALEKAKVNILSFHEKQKQHGFIDSEKEGVIRGQIVRPIEKAGVYVPGGTASYPSSVLMNVLPAKIAGVSQIVMVTPPSKEGIPDVILAAAKISGVDEIYQVGGAQGVAALALGTQSIPQVDKIVGPGNIYVATAKKMLYGQVAIDMIAGPSEIVVLADEKANPTYIAADLLSQAEHDVLARAILITTSEDVAVRVEKELERQLATLPREEIARKALDDYGSLCIVQDSDSLFALMNYIAPEHLEVQLENPMSYLHQIRHAGSIFMGPYASEPLGDYMAGPNHVLPTSGSARFSSPLGVRDFIKTMGLTSYTKEALALEHEAITVLARAEGLEAHARAIDVRFEGDESCEKQS